MPSRNTVRADLAESYYHVYARGASKQLIFLEVADYDFFLGLFKRYLSTEQAKSKTGELYPHYHGRLELTAYCLMGNHFHMLLYQNEQGILAAFMKGVMTSYSRYFNTKYKRTGPLYENRYKASLITNDAYLLHISRYIHLNPRSWRRYPYSSVGSYLTANRPIWLLPKRILETHHATGGYLEFLRDYEEHKAMLDTIKHELADS